MLTVHRRPASGGVGFAATSQSGAVALACGWAGTT
jgi:hypothetical protein